MDRERWRDKDKRLQLCKSHSYDTLRNAVLGRQCCERVCERVQRGVWTES